MSDSNRISLLKNAGLLALIGLLGSLLLAFTYNVTKPRIAEQERRAILASLNQIIPAGRYDNALQSDVIDIHSPGFFKHDDPVRIWRARQAAVPVAAIMQVTAPDGYNGDIVLLIGIDTDQRILGVRVVSHRETPGLGDAIELDKDDWILSFNGKSLRQPPRSQWSVKKDGGAYDQFTGATITPRAVVEAVVRALQYFQSNQREIFSTESTITAEPAA